MSEEHGDDLNFNELVGNLLSSHNASEQPDQALEDVHEPQMESLHSGEVEVHDEVELPEFGAEEEDLAAVVASAIQNMNDQESQEHEVPENFQEIPAASEEPLQVQQEAPEDDGDQQQNQEWAHMLQQSLVDAPVHSDEQLDQDDENLRRAILESLQELNVRDKEFPQELPKEKKPQSKKQSKKSSSKKKKSEDRSSSKKKRHQVKDDDENLLNFEDVIRGFMNPESDAAQVESQVIADVGDKETQALVEATLKAFERELLGPVASTPKSATSSTNTKKKSASSAKKKSSSKKSGLKSKTKTYRPLDVSAEKAVSSKSTSKTKKKKKSHGKAEREHEENDFSKQLVEMVNQVVNTTALDEVEAKDTSPNAGEGFIPPDMHTAPAGLEERADETFDLNQIMQRAMNMAFQEQQDDNFGTSIMEEFNRGLADLNVTDTESLTAGKLQKKPSGKTSHHKDISEVNLSEEQKSSTEPKKMPKPSKDVPSSEKSMKKKYSQVALAAASAAKRRLSEKNKVNRLKVKQERQKLRENKKSKKKEEREKLEEEQRELEEIVAKGPPYPPDLRLTKSGKPKKPHRRWTPEEMEKRASMPPANLHKADKAKKVRKKKSKKLKRVPLYNLKNIPLFNFIKGNISNGLKARQKLNGIEGTLDKMHTQPHHLDINKLAPPNFMTPEQMAKQGNTSDTDKNHIFNTLQRKTVVHREKIPLHPPWDMPAHPPLALPVARRRRKGDIRDSKDNNKVSKHTSDKKKFENFNIRNRIIPAVLLPIINTLKAAARAKAASGASSEESNKHLMNIIKHTKNTIAQTMGSSRRNSTREYPVNIEEDFKENEEKVKRIPIFSLANIRQIDTSSDRPQTGKSNNETPTRAPPLIKVEQEESSSVFASREEPIKQLPVSRHSESLEMEGSAIHEGTKDNTTTFKMNNSEGGVSETSALLATEVTRDGIDEEFDKEMKTIETKIAGDADSGHTGAVPSDQHKATEVLRTPVAGHDNSNETQRPGPINTIESPPIQLKSEENDIAIVGQKNATGETNISEDATSHAALENMVKQHLERSFGDNAGLPNSLSGAIYATLADMIPGFTENTKTEVERGSVRPERKPYKKGPPPVLNLDGLVPPKGSQLPAKIETKPVLGRSASPAMPIIARKPRQKMTSPVLEHTFNVPNFKDLQGKRTMLLKRAKEHLNAEEMAILKKEINKERKRKWREANVEKNWEHDLRARVKRRASAKFGEADSAEKTQWFANEVSKGLAERGIKQEDSAKPEGNGNGGNGRKNAGSTNLSDNEVLNMIATVLNRLEVARTLESELNEIHRPEKSKTVGSHGSKLRKLENPASIENAVGAMRTAVLEEDEFVAVEQRKNEGEMDEVDEDGQIKRPYPDDIPVMVPILKRPKFSNTNGTL